MDWVIKNQEWIFSGVGVVILGIVYDMMRKKVDPESQGQGGITINNTNTISNNPDTLRANQNLLGTPTKSLESYKNETHILFIDDDIKFKVAKILIKSGWVHTKLIKDVDALDGIEISSAQILFIDIQGVGVSLGFNDEGLGLALAIKNKYPNKKVIIYSAESKGDRFHAALQHTDASLNKNADPYEFQKLVEDFTIGLKK